MFILDGTCNIALFLKPLLKWRGGKRENEKGIREVEVEVERGVGIHAALFRVCVSVREREG